MAPPGADMRNQAEESNHNIPSSFPFDRNDFLLQDTKPGFPNKSLQQSCEKVLYFSIIVCEVFGLS